MKDKIQLIIRKAHPNQIPSQEVCTPSMKEAVPVSFATRRKPSTRWNSAFMFNAMNEYLLGRFIYLR